MAQRIMPGILGLHGPSYLTNTASKKEGHIENKGNVFYKNVSSPLGKQLKRHI